jgi:hypothetical protein
MHAPTPDAARGEVVPVSYAITIDRVTFHKPGPDPNGTYELCRFVNGEPWDVPPGYGGTVTVEVCG